MGGPAAEDDVRIYGLGGSGIGVAAGVGGGGGGGSAAEGVVGVVSVAIVRGDGIRRC